MTRPDIVIVDMLTRSLVSTSIRVRDYCSVISMSMMHCTGAGDWGR